MNVLVFRWGSLSDEDMIEAMEATGHRVTQFSWNMKDYENDVTLERQLLSIFLGGGFSYVFSFNYIPVLAKFCHWVKIPYVSWVYDSPHLTLYSDTTLFEENRIFHFDKVMVERLKAQGVKHVFHMPLAVNEKRLEQLSVSEAEEGTKQEEAVFQGTQNYRHEISFLGTLYEDNPYDSIYSFPEYLKGYLDGVLAMQSRVRGDVHSEKSGAQRMEMKNRVFGQELLLEALDEERMKEILSCVKFSLKELYPMSDDRQVFLDMFLLRKTANLERSRMLKLIAGQHENVAVYTGSDTGQFPGIINMGYADYRKDMPKVFAGSKINLNLSLRTIISGIPLRVFDIMGAGGFVLTNDQPELSEFFVEGEDYEAFRSEEEMLGKIDYYLLHEEERKKIAENGCRKVRSRHTYTERIRQIERELGCQKGGCNA